MYMCVWVIRGEAGSDSEMWLFQGQYAEVIFIDCSSIWGSVVVCVGVCVCGRGGGHVR